MDSMESDLHALHQHFIPSGFASPPPRSPAHFTPTPHAFYRPFPAASEDREILGSRDTIDPSDLLPPTGHTILQPSDSDDSDASDATETNDIEDDCDSDGT